MEWLPALVAYLIALVVCAVMKKRDLSNHPDKAKRYKVLPLHYKLACWCGVLPLIVAAPLALFFVFNSPYLAALVPFVGLAAFAGLEIACIPVYRRHGLWN